MKKKILFAVCALLPLISFCGNRPFAEFRQLAAKMKKRSPEDFALGKKLALSMKKEALNRTPFLNRSHLYFETVLWRSSRLWFTEKHWRDRALINNRKYYSAKKSWEKNAAVSYRLMKDYDADGCNILSSKVQDTSILTACC